MLLKKKCLFQVSSILSYKFRITEIKVLVISEIFLGNEEFFALCYFKLNVCIFKNKLKHSGKYFEKKTILIIEEYSKRKIIMFRKRRIQLRQKYIRNYLKSKLFRNRRILEEWKNPV